MCVSAMNADARMYEIHPTGRGGGCLPVASRDTGHWVVRGGCPFSSPRRMSFRALDEVHKNPQRLYVGLASLNWEKRDDI